MTFDQSIGAALEAFRRAQRIDQRSMALYMCMSQASWSRVESGKRPLTVRELYCAAAKLDQPPENITGFADTFRKQVFSIDESKTP